MRYFPSSSSVEIHPLRGMGHTRIRVEDLEQIDVVRVRHVGPYREIGPCLERLFGWTANAGIRTGSILTLSCDDPDTVAQEDLRLDTCVEFFTNAVPPHRISFDLVQGGLCNPIRRVVYTKIFAKPIFEFSDCDFRKIKEIDDLPCMEVYRNLPLEAPRNQLLTDLCLRCGSRRKTGDAPQKSRLLPWVNRFRFGPGPPRN